MIDALTPAPDGFGLSIADHIRHLVIRERDTAAGMARGATPDTRRRWNCLENAASALVRSGDADARVIALHRVNQALGSGSAYEPGLQQTAVLQSAAVGLGADQEPPTDDEFLSMLLAGAVADAVTHFRRQMRHNDGEAAVERMRLAFEQAREQAELARRQVEQVQGEKSRLEELYRNLRAASRELRRGLGMASTDDGNRHEPVNGHEDELPTGVRRRGSTFQAFWRAGGRQHQQGGFKTPQEAAEHRESALREADQGPAHNFAEKVAAGTKAREAEAEQAVTG